MTPWDAFGGVFMLAVALGIPALSRAMRLRRCGGSGWRALVEAAAPLDAQSPRVDWSTMERLTAEELARLSPESERVFREAFLEDPATGAIRFTRKGYAEYGLRFARAGIDISRVRTRDALREACVRSEWVVYEEIRRLVKGHKALEKALEPLWSRP
jgi:hypothetical protein